MIKVYSTALLYIALSVACARPSKPGVTPPYFEPSLSESSKTSLEDLIEVNGDVAMPLDIAKETLQLVQEYPTYKPIIDRAVKEGYDIESIIGAIRIGLTYKIDLWRKHAIQSRDDGLESVSMQAMGLTAKYVAYLELLKKSWSEYLRGLQNN